MWDPILRSHIYLEGCVWHLQDFEELKQLVLTLLVCKARIAIIKLGVVGHIHNTSYLEG